MNQKANKEIRELTNANIDDYVLLTNKFWLFEKIIHLKQ